MMTAQLDDSWISFSCLGVCNCIGQDKMMHCPNDKYIQSSAVETPSNTTKVTVKCDKLSAGACSLNNTFFQIYIINISIKPTACELFRHAVILLVNSLVIQVVTWMAPFSSVCWECKNIYTSSSSWYDVKMKNDPEWNININDKLFLFLITQLTWIHPLPQCHAVFWGNGLKHLLLLLTWA